MLEKGQKAYNFSLQDKEGKVVKLSDFLGKKVVVYFYPKDNTPGCTKQACSYRDNFEEFKNQNAVVIGISKDSIKSHTNFANKYDLPFILLSDPDLEAIKGFGVWVEKNMYGKKYMGISRSTFVIDEKGFVVNVVKKAKPTEDAKNSLMYI